MRLSVAACVLLPFKCICVLPMSTEYYVIQTLRGIAVCFTLPFHKPLKPQLPRQLALFVREMCNVNVTPCFVGISVFFPSFVIENYLISVDLPVCFYSSLVIDSHTHLVEWPSLCCESRVIQPPTCGDVCHLMVYFCASTNIISTFFVMPIVT